LHKWYKSGGWKISQKPQNICLKNSFLC
jgi:hypothetical protein